MGGTKDESETQRASAEQVRVQISSLTREQFQDLTRRLVLYAARLLRAASLDHHAYEIVTGAIDLALDGLLVQAALAAQHPFEVLDDVGDEDGVSIDSGSVERAIEELPGRADEWSSLAILLIAGLLTWIIAGVVLIRR